MVLRTQFMLAQTTAKKACMHPRVAGYIYGAHIGILNWRGVPSGPHAMTLLKASYSELFQNVRFGNDFLFKSLVLAKAAEGPFDAGNEQGVTDIQHWTQTKMPPMHLMAFLTS